MLNYLQAFVGSIDCSLFHMDVGSVEPSRPDFSVSFSAPLDSSVSDSMLFNSGPEIGAQGDRVFDGLTIGLVSGLDNDVGLNLSSVELPTPCPLSFPMNHAMHQNCLLDQAASIAFIAIDRRSEKDLPFDPTGELDNFRSFVEENALALLVAMILQSVVSARRRDIEEEEEEEDDYESVRVRTWEPHLNPQSSHSYTSAKGDGRGTQSSMRGSQIREKFHQFKMASCGSGMGMASAASGLLLTPNATASAKTNTNMLFFPSKINNNLRLVVTVASVGGEAPKPKPPPIGPKREAKVSFHPIMQQSKRK
ncbi:hypothetical protein F3Y22_tig00110503pilonHSYRG00276 [Hibiscus syriacus]|uniref:Uncharacterized protein n=1 Tax=Hibiscus syriacus TaxID=106335 RepID=A0A6A3AFI9_HIBSY|nr:hypothetical protein F3Y22_tig00110503pilonHSYRG00276 [Hibiscus syriacus]